MPREGHDDSVRPSRSHRCAFQSTCPARGTTRHFSLRCTPAEFQSTCPARGTTVSQQERGLPQAISIHVPREGHDGCRGYGGKQARYFNPRAPRGARLDEAFFETDPDGFQSTCPARGTTIGLRLKTLSDLYFNPRAPRGARQFFEATKKFPTIFQSTCPARGTTPGYPGLTGETRLFQSTCPARGTTADRWGVAHADGFQSTCPARGTTEPP